MEATCFQHAFFPGISALSDFNCILRISTPLEFLQRIVMKTSFFILASLLGIPGVQAATTLYETQFHQTAITTESDFLTDASVALTTPSTSLSQNLAANLLVPNVQMNNNNAGWTVTFSFTASQDITISSLDLGFQFVTGTGTRHGNTDTKSGTATVTLAAGESTSTADFSFTRPQADKNGTPTADLQSGALDTPLTVKAGETFTVTVNAKAPNTGGTFLGLSQMSLTGEVVPEPATASLSLLGLAALMLRRRR